MGDSSKSRSSNAETNKEPGEFKIFNKVLFVCLTLALMARKVKISNKFCSVLPYNAEKVFVVPQTKAWLNLLPLIMDVLITSRLFHTECSTIFGQ